MLWLVVKEVCPKLRAAHVALFSDNSPTIVWVKRLVSRGSLVSTQLVQALTLRLKKAGASPLTPLHISGEENYMTDIPSRSFSSNLAWFLKNDTDLLNLFNKNLPLSNQASWTVFSPSNAASVNVISVLRIKKFEMGEWIHIKKAVKHVGKIGVPLSDLWKWSLGYRIPRTISDLGSSQAPQLAYAWAAMVKENKLQLARSLGRSRPLARRSIWPMKAIPQKLKAKKISTKIGTNDGRMEEGGSTH